MQHQLSGHIKQHDIFVQEKMATLTADPVPFQNEYGTFDIEIAKKNILFSEAVRTLSLKEINTDPVGVAQRIISYYLTL